MDKKMQKPAKYVIFKTRWGYFGLAGSDSTLCRSYLPEPTSANIKRRLLENLPDVDLDENYFKKLQEQITGYFEGARVDFSRVPIILEGLSVFSQQILRACREIEIGQTVTYSGLAKKTGRPSAGRAVGGVMARNPLPLIIPCHRVIRTDGKMGGFTAPGGVSLKKKMLELEQQVLVPGKTPNVA
ncbi:MAG: methylated-DNA--[protein]-cysteine S-methyltransferase [Sedimentisphaerales bacterium]|nr:methylated-DNA--[protein]-cysteine S-methyltransferase [Sedimentisphaerales bacterium]